MNDPEPTRKHAPAWRGSQTSSTMPAALYDFLCRHRTVTVLGGAGCSTGSGIPDYRDEAGHWKHRKPVQFSEFLSSAAVRQRYWARSFAGWNRIGQAVPNPAHLALARLEQAGRINCLVTQNVDNLHRIAGSRNVIDLHGVLHRIRCLRCKSSYPRAVFQQHLSDLNPHWSAAIRSFAPDGDANLPRDGVGNFAVPDCSGCGGLLKPDVVFFGESVPGARVERAASFLQRSEALLIVGSSLMVFSGFRFARMAHAAGKPIAIINRGITRADDMATLKLEEECGQLLTLAAERFNREMNGNARPVDHRL